MQRGLQAVLSVVLFVVLFVVAVLLLLLGAALLAQLMLSQLCAFSNLVQVAQASPFVSSYDDDVCFVSAHGRPKYNVCTKCNWNV